MGKRKKKGRIAAEAIPESQPRTKWRHRWIIGGGIAASALVCTVWALAREPAPAIYDYEVVNSFPHDPQAYSQGLAYADGVLYEGTGQYGQSELRRVELETGRVLQSASLDRRFFGEGITLWEGQAIQLTWQSRVGFVYDKNSLSVLKRFRYAGEGWGLTHDGKHLIMSDGSSNLRFLDPETYRVARRLSVRGPDGRIDDLNELEYINGLIWANIWHKDYIACISPRTGDVRAWVDLRGLLPQSQRANREAVLNGIAYDKENNRLFVTGKNWPKLFEIRLKRREQ